MRHLILLNIFIFTALTLCSAQSQHILLGQSPQYIIEQYNNDPEYLVSIDTISARKLLINCRSANIYPHHTFEIDRYLDKCISYGFVSKNPDILNTYVQILDHAGNLVNSNESLSEFTYMLDLPDKQIYYTFKRPFLNNSLKSKRTLYYMVITEDRKKLQVGN